MFHGIYGVYSTDVGGVYISLLELVSLSLLVANLLLLTYLLIRYVIPGLILLWLFTGVLTFLRVLHFYVLFNGFWTPIQYKLYYGLSAVLPVLMMFTFMFLYGQVEKWFVNVSIVYFVVLTLFFTYTVAISSVKAFLLSTPHIGGTAMDSLPRMVHPLLTIPSFILVIYFTSYYMWYRGVYGDIVFLFLSNLSYAIGGTFLRFGAIEIFHFFDMLGSINLFIGSYFLIRAVFDGRIYSDKIGSAFLRVPIHIENDILN